MNQTGALVPNESMSTSLLDSLINTEQNGESSAALLSEVGRIDEPAVFESFLQMISNNPENIPAETGDLSNEKETEIKCQFCPAVFTKRNNYSRHVNQHTQEKKFDCRYCDKSFLRIDQMKSHTMNHIKKAAGFDCPVAMCDTRFEQHSELTSHVEEHFETEDSRDCKICSKKFFKAERLLFHYQTGHEDVIDITPASKTIKSEVISDNESLPLTPIHSNVPEQEESPVAPFSFGAAMKEEVEVNNNDIWNTRYSCDQCHKSYTNNANLRRHQRISHKQQNEETESPSPKLQPVTAPSVASFDCPIYACNKLFPNFGELETHMDIFHVITPASPEQCKLCSKKFTNSVDLLLHYENGHGDPKILPFIKRKSEDEKEPVPVKVIKHEMREDGSMEKRYPCDQCGKTYSNFANMRRHHRKAHSVQSSSMDNYLVTNLNDSVSNEKFDCPVDLCEMEFDEHSKLKDHLNDYHVISERAPEKCRQCEKEFRSSHRLLLHYQLKHSGKADDSSSDEPSPKRARVIKREFVSPPISPVKTPKKTEKEKPKKVVVAPQDEIVTSGPLVLEEAPVRMEEPQPMNDDIEYEMSPVREIQREEEMERNEVVESGPLEMVIERPATTEVGTSTASFATDCDACGITFNDLTMSLTHQMLHCPEDPFKCKLCGAELGNKYQFMLHGIYNNH